MISALVMSGPSEWMDRLRAALAPRATVLEVDPRTVAEALPANVAVDAAFLEVAHLTDRVAETVARLRALHPECAVVCLASEEVAARAEAEGALQPDHWFIMPASDLQLRTYLEAVAGSAAAGARGRDGRAPGAHGEAANVVVSGGGHGAAPESILCRVTGRMMSSADAPALLAAYCDAVHELAQCVSHCLLWRELEAPRFHLVRAEGLPPAVEEVCRLSLDDPLPRRLQLGRGIVTCDGLNGGPEGAAVAKQLAMGGGVLALPLSCQGTLRGIMIVGPKAIGSPYTEAEAEALFMLSASAAAAVRQIELHRELAARNSYIDQVLSAMESGVVTISAAGDIRVCNPYAARVLRLDPAAMPGGGLRELPAPLGDHLFAGLRYGEERTREEIAVFGGEVVLRFSTRRLVTSQDEVIGAMLLLEDITAERALAEERRKAERSEVISQVMARFAHELKNPLATIHTFAELLPTNIDDPEFRRFCSEHVRRDVHRLDDLVAKLVSLTEPSAPRGATIKLPELLQRAVDRVAILDDDAPDHIVSELDESLPAVRGDLDVMATALAHLLRYGLGAERRTVTVQADLSTGGGGNHALTVLVRAPVPRTVVDDPQQLLDPSYVLDHPDIDLGPSAGQRLIEGQGGSLSAYVQEDDLVFSISLRPADDAGSAPYTKE